MSSVLNPVELGRAFVIVVSSSLNRKKCKIKQTKNSPARTRQTLRFDSHMVSLLPTPNADGGGTPLTPAVPTPEAQKLPLLSLCKGGGQPPLLSCHGAIFSAPFPFSLHPSKMHIVRNVLGMYDLGQIVAGVPICLRYITGPLRKRNSSILESSRGANWPFPPRAIIREASPVQPESQYLAHPLALPRTRTPHPPPQQCPSHHTPFRIRLR